MRKKVATTLIIFSILALAGIVIGLVLPKEEIIETTTAETTIDIESAYAEVTPPEGEGPGLSEEELALVSRILSEKLPYVTEPYEVLELTVDRIVVEKDGETYEVFY